MKYMYIIIISLSASCAIMHGMSVSSAHMNERENEQQVLLSSNPPPSYNQPLANPNPPAHNNAPALSINGENNIGGDLRFSPFGNTGLTFGEFWEKHNVPDDVNIRTKRWDEQLIWVWDRDDEISVAARIRAHNIKIKEHKRIAAEYCLNGCLGGFVLAVFILP